LPKPTTQADEADDEVTDKGKWAERLKNAVCQGHELDKAITQMKEHQFNSLTLRRSALICEEDRVHTHKSVTQYLGPVSYCRNALIGFVVGYICELRTKNNGAINNRGLLE
jgi:hypothetical protein